MEDFFKGKNFADNRTTVKPTNIMFLVAMHTHTTRMCDDSSACKLSIVYQLRFLFMVNVGTNVIMHISVC